MCVKKESIDFLNLSLGKSNLIEASAGTGKTNLISLLYLRFLFGINLDNNFLSLHINNILIVTFTELAVLEIKSRILNNIKNLRISCINNYLIDDKIKDIYIYIKDIPNIINILWRYEYNINNFSIFTIHSFINKILFSNFINSKINFYDKILENEDHIIYDSIVIFWKKYFYPLPVNINKIILNYWSDPIELLKSVKPILNFSYLNFNYYNKYKSINECYKKIIVFINFIKSKWLLNFKYIYRSFYLFKVSNFIYSNVNLDKWFNQINIWCSSITIDFNIPKYLVKFSFNYLSKYTNSFFFLDFFLFHDIDNLLLKINDLYKFIIIYCYKYIIKKTNFFKNKNYYLSFNDLINKFNNIIVNDNNFLFINFIRKNFPFVLIDEFQDTDFFQYNIFNKIYVKNISVFKTKIIFLGDPKQSIYTFRGANIFNYINIKKNVDFLYTFNINWRSSYGIIKSINYLFSKISNPFFFKEILYNFVNYNKKSKLLFLTKNNKFCPSINFFILKNINYINYKYNIAKYCAFKICKLLDYKKYNVNLHYYNNIKRNIVPSDIAVLVYSNLEVKILFDVFQKFNLPVDCDLDKNNIFNTIEAKEVMFILKCVLYPESILNIRNALSTYIFNFNLLTINYYIKNEFLLNKIIDEFYFYYNLWDKNGIFSMLNFIFINKLKYIKKKNFIKYKKYKNNFFNIIEILGNICFKYRDKNLILNWLTEKIYHYDINMDNQFYLRSNSLLNGIKISTIHKSKGLQYNIVWLPFLISIKNYNNFFFYHNRKNNRVNISFNKSEKKNFFFNEELYSEEMRLLYVSITRSVYQCNIFIYEFNNIYSRNFYSTSIGRLICNDKKINFYNINKEFDLFSCKYIKFNIIDLFNYNIKKIYFLYKKLKKKKVKKNKYINFLKKKIFNYSSFIKKLYIKDKFYINDLYKNIFNNKNIFIFNNKNIGNFFHVLLEKIDFNLELKNNFILKYMYKFNIKKKYFFFIKKILFNVLNVNLYPLNINLLSNKIFFFYKEFDFFLSIFNSFDFFYFNKVIKKYDYISKFCKDININKKFYGFLNGIIDFIFIYENKFYIVDYKSNFIGYNYNDYDKKNILKVMIDHRYDIQYQIYSLALHNHLSLNIKNYSYKKNFGGIYYIFLRGLFLDNYNMSYTGLFFIKPKLNLINKLNYFFKKK